MPCADLKRGTAIAQQALVFGSRCLLAALLVGSLSIGARPALAQSAPADDSVNPSPHRVSFELGLFDIPKDDDAGWGLGVGYAFRPVHGLELGGGLRYLDAPAKYLDFDTREWSLAASVRGYGELASPDRVELGITLRGGALALNDRGLCCLQVALAPDLRVRVARDTALQLAAEVSLGSTGAHNVPNTDQVDVIFYQRALWLSLVQTL
jgi:hypothetical protein